LANDINKHKTNGITKTMTKNCIDCKFSTGEDEYLICTNPLNFKDNIITGKKDYKHKFCEIQRLLSENEGCSVEANWFEAKDNKSDNIKSTAEEIENIRNLIKQHIATGRIETANYLTMLIDYLSEN